MMADVAVTVSTVNAYQRSYEKPQPTMWYLERDRSVALASRCDTL